MSTPSLDAVGCCLQVIKRSVAAAGEIGSAPLAAEMLDVVPDAPFAVAGQGVHLVIGDAEVVAERIETGETGGGDLFLATSSALAFRIGLHFTLDWAGLQAQALTAVWAILGRARFPASREARFGVLPPASESRGVELPAKPQEQDG